MLSDTAIALQHRYISLSCGYADLKYIKSDVSEWWCSTLHKKKKKWSDIAIF